MRVFVRITPIVRPIRVKSRLSGSVRTTGAMRGWELKNCECVDSLGLINHRKLRARSFAPVHKLLVYWCCIQLAGVVLIGPQSVS